MEKDAKNVCSIQNNAWSLESSMTKILYAGEEDKVGFGSITWKSWLVRRTDNGKVNAVMLRALVVKVSLLNSELVTLGDINHHGQEGRGREP